MRYAVLSDIHANLPALEAVLARVRKLGVDDYLWAGDVVGYGAHPNECIEVMAALGGTMVAGNHELIALGALSDHRSGRLARESLHWTREVLTPRNRALLSGLPPVAHAPGRVVVAHGSLDDVEEYVLRGEQVTRQLQRLGAEHPSAGFLVLGHTHRAAAWAWDGALERVAPTESVALDHRRWLLNPGAVGQSRERLPYARFMILDLSVRLASFHAIPFDIERCRRALSEAGLPLRSYHLVPTRRSAASRHLRRIARRVIPAFLGFPKQEVRPP